MSDPFWLFAYGSLIWRPNIPHRQRVRGFVEGYQRRFWQASPDHRGVPEQPGRVVTLVQEAGACCYGVAYEVSGEDEPSVLSELDARESAGYARVTVRFCAKDRNHSGEFEALTYVAGPGNPNYIGDTEMSDLAHVIRASSGPSGHNAEYVLRLAEALSDLGAEDPHVFELANLLADPDDVEEPV